MVFAVLGYMAQRNNQSIDEVATEGIYMLLIITVQFKVKFHITSYHSLIDADMHKYCPHSVSGHGGIKTPVKDDIITGFFSWSSNIAKSVNFIPICSIAYEQYFQETERIHRILKNKL